MNREEYKRKARKYLYKFCEVKPNRRLGSDGNREATKFFADKAKHWEYQLDTSQFDCLDYKIGEVSLNHKNKEFQVKYSPYSLGCEVTSELVQVTSVDELEEVDCYEKILLMKDEICQEQLMPKNFVFYHPEHHRKIISLLEVKQPAGIITATSKNPEQVGAIYPYPLIFDGDFNIPSVFCTAEEGDRLSKKKGENFYLKIDAQRIPAKGNNVILRKNQDSKKKIVVCAHIDAYLNSPGASDNASGVTVELILAEMLRYYQGLKGIEIIAFNGEDHYSVAGQMDYLKRYGHEMEHIELAINIDDVGFHEGGTSISYYECSEKIQAKINKILESFPDIGEGFQWFQGDHMIFAQKGIPTIAVTCEKAYELMATITHSEKDTPKNIDTNKLINIAEALTHIVHACSISNS
ncbi:M28 family metallopeptidase [Thermoproteota archaeon]